jgi:hypothetical protein
VHVQLRSEPFSTLLLLTCIAQSLIENWLKVMEHCNGGTLLEPKLGWA